MSFLPAGNRISSEIGSTSAAKLKRRTLTEVSVGYGLILIAIWTPRPLQTIVSFAALAWVLFATVRSGPDWRTMGLGFAGFLRSLWIVGVAAVLAVSAVLLVGAFHRMPLPDFLMTVVGRYWIYALWALLQQFLLLDFILLRLLKLLPGKIPAVTAAAGLFSLAHVPNPVLIPATFLWGFIACMLFLHYRNIYTLAMVHILFGVCIAVTVPGPIDHNMRVGLGYLTYSPPSHHRIRNHHRARNEDLQTRISASVCLYAGTAKTDDTLEA